MIDWNKNLATTVQHTKQSGIRRFLILLPLWKMSSVLVLVNLIL